MAKIYVLIGPPACGKSTLARKMHNEDPTKVIINRDNIREARGTYWIPDQEDYISDIEEFEVRSAIKHNLSPIIDATNLNPKTMEKWENLSVELGVDLEKVYLPYITFKEALERDIKRGLEGGRAVGEKTLRTFYKKYYWDKYEKEVYGDRHPSSIPNDSLPPAVIFDLDFTIMYRQDRGPFEYAKADTDKMDPRAKWMIQRWIDDGDGCFYVTNRATQFSISNSYNFDWNYLVDYLKTNFNFNCKIIRRNKKTSSSCIRNSNQHEIYKFISQIYNNSDEIWLKRKYEKVLLIYKKENKYAKNDQTV